MGCAVFSDRDEFAVDHRVRLHALKCFRNLEIGVADDLPVTAVERDPTTLDFRDHPKTIEFVLFDKYPSSQRDNQDIPDEAEIKFRRIFHFFRASVLGTVSERAHQSNQDMAAVAEVWGEYIASAGSLTSIVEHTAIWASDELAWFAGDFDEEAQIRNVLYSVVPGFLWKHDEMLDRAKRRFRVMTSLLKSYTNESI